MQWHKTKYPGVRYRKSETRKFKRRADRSFVIHYKRNRKLVNETIGWESQGATLAKAVHIRGQIIQNIRHGEGFQSLKEKRELEEARRQAESLERERIESANAPFDILAKKYLEWAKNNKKTWWVDAGAYRKHIQSEIGHLPFKDISVITLERLKRNLRKKNLSERTVQCYLNVIKHMFNKGLGWGLCSGKNPVAEAAKVDKNFLRISDNQRLRFLNREETKILLVQLKKHSSQLHDIIRNPKNGETRQAYITPQLKKMFLSRRKENGLIFKDRNGKRIREVSTTFERVAKRLGFNEGIKDRQYKLVFHSLRHTFASWLALQGETLLTIKELMGHKDIKMTLRYAHLTPGQKQAAVMRLAQ